jgi:hypothetical protein
VDFKTWRFSGLDWLVAAVIAAEALFAVLVWRHGPLAPIPMQVGGPAHLVRWADRTEAAFVLARSAIFAAAFFSIAKTAEVRGHVPALLLRFEALKFFALIPAMRAVPVLSGLASAWS